MIAKNFAATYALISFLLVSATAQNSNPATPPKGAIGDRAAPAATSAAALANGSASTARLREETFEMVWRTINETHYDPTFGGLDWNKVRAEYAPRVAAAKSDAEFYGLLRRMIGELHLSHFVIYPPGALDQPATKEAANVGVGIDVRFIDGQAVVTRIAPNSVAARSGEALRPGVIIRKIDDTPVAQILERLAKAEMSPAHRILYATSSVINRLGGKPGATLRLTILDEKNSEREVTLVREATKTEMSPPFGNFPSLPIEFDAKRIDGNVGYIRFNTFLIPLMERIRGAVRSMADAPGIIFDLRGNPGGFGGMAAGIAGTLISEQASLGTMKMRSGHINFVAYPQPAPYTGPVIILIDALSLSTSEIFAAGVQEVNRAVIIGERSGGMALPSVIRRLPTGALLQHAVGDFTTPKGNTVEGRGAIPDIEVKWDRRVLLKGRDAQLEAAVKYILERGRKQTARTAAVAW